MRNSSARLLGRCFLELLPLEDRTVPAAAAYAAGTLTVTAATADTITVGMDVNGVPGFLLVKNGATSIFDSATNQQVSNLVVKAGKATNYSLDIDAAVSLANLTVGGASASTSVTLGAGTLVNANFSFTGNSAAPANDTIDVPFGARIGGNVTLTLNGGGNTLHLAGTIGGKVKVSAGGGSDTIGLAGTGALIVGSSMAMNLGNGSNNVTGGSNRLSVGKNLIYTGGLNDDRITTGSSDLRVGGNVTVNLAGASAFNSWGSERLFVGGNFTVAGGAGEDDLYVQGPNEVGGNVVTKLGAGINILEVGYTGGAATIVGGSVRYTGQTGRDALYLDNIVVGKNVTATFGGGASQVFRLGTQQGAPVQIGGSVTLTTGDDIDYVDIFLSRIGGPLSLSTFGGVDTVRIDDTNVNGPVSVALGAGSDTLQVDTLATNLIGTPLPGMVLFESSLTVLGGDGNDSVDLSDSSGNSVRIGGNIKLIGGLGSDNFYHFEAGNLYLGAIKFEDFELGESF